MSDASKPTKDRDPGVDAALREYLERIDRGEVVDREKFIDRHAEIAEALRSFFAAEDPLRKLAQFKASLQSAGISTRSFAAQGQETVPPRSKSDRLAEAAGIGFLGQLGRYRIVRTLGSGAMGTVYLAEDTELERKVALKTPHFEDDPTGELVARFYREARAAATLRHAHICPVYDVGQIDGRHFISMAYIDGRPLSQFIDGKKPRSERQILIVIQKLALALQQAHEHGIVHRDLKPSNIMVDKKGEPIIMDFGLARKAHKEGEASLTQNGAILGSPAYMSPEQVDGDPDSVGPASDQYSLGVVLYELLTGQLPFRGSVVSVLAQIITKEPSPPSELRPGLDPRIEVVCLRIMAKKASDRFGSMKAVADEVSAILKQPVAEPAPAAQEPSPTAIRPPAGPISSAAEIGKSQIRKSLKPKVLTETDLTSLEELVRKCLRHRDYEQMIQIIERIPEDRRSESLQTLLEKALQKLDEISFLLCDIDEADRLKDAQTALRKAEELLTIKPRHHRAREIQGKYSGYGAGGAVRIGLVSQFTKPLNDGGWIPWTAMAFGLAVFGVMSGVIVIYLNKTTVVIDVKDPGVSVAITDKGKKIEIISGPRESKVEVEPGDQELKITYAGLETITKSVTLKRGDKKTVTVSLADGKLIAKLGNDVLVEHDVKSGPAGSVKRSQDIAQSPRDEKKTDTPAATPSADPDRTTAEWVLSIGGRIGIEINRKERDIAAPDRVPPQPFQLRTVRLPDNRKVSDAGLACALGCRNLKVLDLYLAKVSDTGLAYFKDCQDLTYLSLGGTQVTDAGLANFKHCENLGFLGLRDTRVTDAGLANFKHWKNLGHLELINTRVSDAGLACFKGCENLWRLDLGDTEVTDTGLALFKDWQKVYWLGLSGTQVTDTGLAYLEDCRNLGVLGLDGTNVSDAGVVHLESCRNLTELDLAETKVTDASLERLAHFRKLKSLVVKATNVTEKGVKKFAAARPRCKIEWNGGVFGPKEQVATTNAPTADGIPSSTTDPDRRAAEWVLSIGGRPGIERNGEVRDVDVLPSEPFKLCKVQLYGNQKLSDAGLGCFRGCRNLKELGLYAASNYTDAGLTNFRGCKDLAAIWLSGHRVTDAGLANFKECKGLKTLAILDTNVSDRGLAYFKNCENLESVELRQSLGVTDAGVAPFLHCPKLKFLNLYVTGVTDAGVAHLDRCVNLEELYVNFNSPQVTDATARKIAGLRRLKKLSLGGTQLTNAGLASLQGLTELEFLGIGRTRIRGSGLPHLRNLIRLKELALEGLGLTDGDLVHLRNLKSVELLGLAGARVSGPGLVNLKVMEQLRDLDLNDSRMTNSGLEHLKTLSQLEKLHLRGTQVTDVGLHHLEGLTNLDELDLTDTKVTTAGVEKLQKSLPACKIIVTPKAP